MPVPKFDHPTVYDGSKGTYLAPEMVKAGREASDLSEWLNLLAPEAVARCHRAYIDAGSEVIETNTFNGNRFRLEKYGLADKVQEVNLTAARIAKGEAGTRVSVAGKLGPSGKMLVMGEVTAEELRDAFAEQAKALEEGGADFFHVETMTDLSEVVAAVEGARSVSKLPVAVTMSFDTGKPEAGLRTMMGVTPGQLVAKGDELGLLAVGANCGLGLTGYQTLFQQFVDAAAKMPLIAKVNAGIPVSDGKNVVYDGTPEKMAEHAVWVAGIGVRLIGVCCGSGPEHIEAIASALARLR
ncbi:MAG TPA: homocysteine S-methyltransferase family protein [Dehalococcoidia bacterium]|nr:homocysteine S-methyltransferase family protein [Dehalococcoidia bacterium]